MVSPSSKSKLPRPPGQFTLKAAWRLIVIDSEEPPLRSITEPCPLTCPPAGEVKTVVTPCTRVTGMCSLCTFTSVAATRSGWKAPSSRASVACPTCPNSVRPMVVPASTKPG